MRKIHCAHCVIRGRSVIQDLPDRELDAFRACGTSALYKPRQVIFHEDSPATGLYILCHGAVKLYQSDRFGHQHTLDIAAPGDVLGELPVDAGASYSTSAEALTDSQLCYLPRQRLVEFIQAYPMVGVRLLEAFSKSVCVARRRIRALALKRAESRLAELLMQFARAGGEPLGDGTTRLTLGYSRRELAEMIGVSPETAIRLLSRLQQKQAINMHHRELVITDADKLARLAHHDSTAAQ
jgi:CRP/FNR family transcriptional regulator